MKRLVDIAELPPVDGMRALSMLPIGNGRSNPTFAVTTCAGRYVLRSRPQGETNPTAHRIDREVRVLRALAGTAVAVPEIVLASPGDAAVEPWYVMAFVEGAVPEDPALPAVEPAARRRAFESAIDGLAALHAVDPASVALDGFGPAGDHGRRQIARWSARNAEGAAPPGLTALGERLAAAPPRQARRTIVHGDYRIGNLVLAPDGAVRAVLDWELSTLGDPLSDLAYFSLSYLFPSAGLVLPGLAGAALPPGVPSLADLLSRYAAETGHAMPDDWPCHQAVALFRSASIALGVFRRRALQTGNAPSTGDIAVVAAIADLGLALVP